jgi:hypothetical protein
MSVRPAIHFHIERLVLDGFPSTDRDVIAGAVQRELTRLFGEQPTPARLANSAALARLDAGSFSTTPPAALRTIGTQTARAVFGGLNR